MAFSTQRKETKNRDWKELKVWQVTKIRPFLGPIDQETLDNSAALQNGLVKEQMEEQSVNHILNEG